MNLTNLILILAAIFVLVIGAVVFGIAMVFYSSLRYRGQRLVTCPETLKPAAVHVNLGNVARKLRLAGNKFDSTSAHDGPSGRIADRNAWATASRSGKLPRLEHRRRMVQRKVLRLLPEAL
jgi:hypothetical protein